MSGIIIIDANVLRNITQGNQAAAQALKRLLSTGNRVYIARAAYDEIIILDPPLGEHYRNLIRELNIEIAPATKLQDRVNTYANNVLQEPKPSKGIPGPMPEYGGKRVEGVKTRPADAFVAAEAKALNAELWTLDQQFTKQAGHQGVRIAAESSIKSVGGAEIPSVGRKLLGLRFKWTGWKPRINLKNIKLTIRARGFAFVRGLGVAIILSLIGGWLEARRDRKAIEEGFEKLQPKVNDELNKLLEDVGKLQLQVDGIDKVYANVTWEIHFGKPRFLQGNRFHKEYDYPYGDAPSVWLSDMRISFSDITTEKEEKNLNGTVKYITHSFEVEAYQKEDLEHFRELKQQYLAANTKRRIRGSDEIYTKEARRLRAQIIFTFGPDIGFLQDWNIGEDNIDYFEKIEAKEDEAEAPAKTGMKL